MAYYNDLNKDLLWGNEGSSMLDAVKSLNDAWAHSITENYSILRRHQEEYYNKEKAGIREMLKAKLNATNTDEKTREQIIKRLTQMEIESIEYAEKIQRKVDKRLFEQSTFYDQKRMLEREKDRLKEYKDRLQMEIEIDKVTKKGHLRDDKEYKEKKRRLNELAKKEKEILELEEKRAKITYSLMSTRDKAAFKRERATKAENDYMDIMQKFGMGQASGGDVAKAKEAAISAGWEASLAEAMNNLSNFVQDTIKSGLNQIDQTIDTLYANQGRINTRLMGARAQLKGVPTSARELFSTIGHGGYAQITYQDMLRDVAGILGISPFVSQKAMIENITKAVDEGIAYNIEQRAFLATISENIASTFDVFDGNLMKLIRLQQADSTAARLGMEAVITQFLNAQFRDTSYLKNTYDTVSQALLETSAQLTRDESLALEFIAQKWLGSLSSLGLSESTATTIATGLNMLGTGNVSGLASNPQMQTLLAMSASRAGVSYADILTGGLTSGTANELLKSMVEYLKEISETNNMVVKSQYANILGLSMADFRALQSLSSSDITNIYGETLDYGGATMALKKNMATMFTRMSVGQMMNNLVENAITGIASSIGANPFAYASWKLTDLIERATGGINIPAGYFMGTGVDLNATLTQLMKLGIAGGSVLSLIGPIVSSLGNLGGLTRLDAWGGEEFNRVGAGMIGLSANGFQRGSSEIMYVGSASYSDMYENTILAQKEQAQKTQELVSFEKQVEKDIYELIESTIGDNGKSYIRVVVVNEQPIKVDVENAQNMYAYTDNLGRYGG